MFCSNCGSKLQDGAKFCSECGTKVVSVSNAQVDDVVEIQQTDKVESNVFEKRVEMPRRTKIAFDWSNVVDEPHKKEVANIKSPWDMQETVIKNESKENKKSFEDDKEVKDSGGADEKAIFDEMKPSHDMSRTMSFIDILKKEKEFANSEFVADDIDNAPDFKQANYDETEASGEEKLLYVPHLYGEEELKAGLDKFRQEFETPDTDNLEYLDGLEQKNNEKSDKNIEKENPDLNALDEVKKIDTSTEIKAAEENKEVEKEPVFDSSVLDAYTYIDDVDTDYEKEYGRIETKEPADENLAEEIEKESEFRFEKENGMDLEAQLASILEGGRLSRNKDYSEENVKSKEVITDTYEDHEITEDMNLEDEIHTEDVISAEDLYLNLDTNVDGVETAQSTMTPLENEKRTEDEFLSSYENEKEAESAVEESSENAVKEEDLFNEMNLSPKKTGMTIASPADKESEIDALKKRLAELMGTTEDEPVVIENEDKLDIEDLTAEIEEITDTEEIESEIQSVESKTSEHQQDTISEAENLNFDTFEKEESCEEVSEDVAEDINSQDEDSTAESEMKSENDRDSTANLSDNEKNIDELSATEEPIAEIADEIYTDSETFSESVEVEPVDHEEKPEEKKSDAFSLEELEKDIFGDVDTGEADNETTKKIDKFYTLYRKNEEFQRLLDEEYNKLKGIDPGVSAVAGDSSNSPLDNKKAENEAITKNFTEDKKANGLKSDNSGFSVSGLNTSYAGTEDGSVSSAPVAVEDPVKDKKAARKAEKLAKKEAKKATKEKKSANNVSTISDDENADAIEEESGSNALTIIAVIIAVILVILLAVILIIQIAPDSAVAFKINSVVENITSHFSAVDNIENIRLM